MPVTYILHQNTHRTTPQQGEPLVFANMLHSEGQDGGTSRSLFKECHPADIFVVMGRKGLGNVLSDGMAGMRNGNCFAFYMVFGKGSKNKKSIGVGWRSRCLSRKGL